jgi:hypothetical protein
MGTQNPNPTSASVPPLAYEMVEPPAGTTGAADAPIAIILHGLMGRAGSPPPGCVRRYHSLLAVTKLSVF